MWRFGGSRRGGGGGCGLGGLWLPYYYYCVVLIKVLVGLERCRFSVRKELQSTWKFYWHRGTSTLTCRCVGRLDKLVGSCVHFLLELPKKLLGYLLRTHISF